MRVLRLPEQGQLLVSTDLQGNLRDFRQLMTHFRAAGPDAWLVITGDLIHGPDEDTVAHWPEHLGTPYRDESPALIEAFIEEQRLAPGRVHCLLGNHDHSHIGGPRTAKFYDDEATALEDALGPIGTAQLQGLIRTFPLIAVGRCGAVLSHGAPSARVTSLDEFEKVPLTGYRQLSYEEFLQVPVLGPLLWSRMARPEEAKAFLKAVGGTLALYGHDVVRDGYASDSEDQLCFSTSFGVFDERKVFVQLDLAAQYPTVHALRAGVELRQLYPR